MQWNVVMLADTPSVDPQGNHITILAGTVVNTVAGPPNAAGDGVLNWSPPPGTKVVPAVYDPAAPLMPVASGAVPQSAEMWKAKAVMAGKPSKSNVGKTLLDDANGIIATASQPVQIAWANAAELSRSSQTVALLAASIGLSGADLDALFTAAAAFTLP
jgi:hypothetical protein